ncbi:MAG TPA: tetratricopeptide repeat protein [Verrucomicrobiae bacterium]|nr:tetratricopeptide repeat protein [Verrucomicrobiae bacterium]
MGGHHVMGGPATIVELMSRFGNLEFGGEFEQPLHGQLPLKDERYYLAEANQAIEQGDFEPALRSFGRAVEQNPLSAPAWTGQVRALIELDEFQEAKLWADKALERFPREPELLAAKAVALARTGDLDASLAFSDASIEERGDTPYIWLARGDVLLARGEKRADYCFDKALTLAAANWVIRWMAARIRAFYRQFALALKLAQQALELRPDHPLLWLLAGRCQKELGLVGPARQSFQQALQISPRLHEAATAISGLSETSLITRFGGWWRQRFRQ